MESKIQLISIAELLDGRTFLIPSYQRGYRWTEKEIRDFLNDLYSFALKPDKKKDEFYCLQPIITQKFTDEDLIEDTGRYLTTLTKTLNDNVIRRKRSLRDRLSLEQNYNKILLKIDSDYDMILDMWRRFLNGDTEEVRNEGQLDEREQQP